MTAQKIIKRLVLLAISIAFLFAPKISLAAWVKYPGNPIIVGVGGAWDGTHVSNPCVLYIGGKYQMWYGGSIANIAKIGYAESINGIDTWVRQPKAAIEAKNDLGWDEREVGHPTVVYTPSKGYEMWYIAISPRWSGGSDRFRVRYATSLNGIDWNVYPAYILTGTSGSWDSGGISRGLTVILTPKGYEMWYSGVGDSEGWGIGYASSPDGITWTKKPGQAITKSESWEKNWLTYPNIIHSDGLYEIWYNVASGGTSDSVAYAYSTNGTDWVKPPDKNPVILTGPSSFDSFYLVSPSVIKLGINYKMWYGGCSTTLCTIGYAENILGPTVTPMPTSTPTPLPTATPTLLPTNTPTPSPTPSPVPPHILVFLPGLGASWNHESILYGNDRPVSEWFMTPGVHIYDGLIKTFINAGYQTDGSDKNLYIFNYNWAKPVEQITNDLKNYLIDTVKPAPDAKIDLVGHSLGGLVARTYFQNNPNNQIDHLLTLGSPQHGVAQVYYLWEGGDVSRLLPGWQRFGAGLILHLRKSFFATPKNTVQQTLPVMRDLLPTFNYLKRYGIEKPISEMSEKNTWLNNLNSSPPLNLTTRLNTLAGLIPDSTLRWINVQNRNWLDTLLGLYPDGRPVDQELSVGDKTVLGMSAHLDSETITDIPNLNHGDLVSQPAGIQKIMEALNLSPSSVSHISKNLDYSQMLVFYLASPAIISITDQDGNPIGTTDGKLAIIPSAIPGSYRVNVIGTGSGKYSLYIGQITKNMDSWTVYTGMTGVGQSRIFPILFQPDHLLDNPIFDPSGELMIKSAQTKMNLFKGYLTQNAYDYFLKTYLSIQFKQTENKLIKKDFEGAIISLYDMRLKISLWPKINPNLSVNLKNLLQEIIKDLEDAYISRQSGKPSYNQKLLTQEIKVAQTQLTNFENKLKLKIQKSRATTEDGLLFQLAQQKLDRAKNSTSFEAHINALGARSLSQEGIITLR